MNNPLQKYFRQPKIYIGLPSRGQFYPAGTLLGDHNYVPVYAMTGMDEIMMKTPDALYSGASTIKLIESCCPYIANGAAVPSLDIDALLLAIRIATYGDELTISKKCECGEENQYQIHLPSLLDSYTHKQFHNRLAIDELTVVFKPLNYQQITDLNIQNYALQKKLSHLTSDELTDQQRQDYMEALYRDLATMQMNVILNSIDHIITPTEVVSDPQFIREWMDNTVKTSYHAIKSHLEAVKQHWSIPSVPVKCEACGREDQVTVGLDQSNFFD